MLFQGVHPLLVSSATYTQGDKFEYLPTPLPPPHLLRPYVALYSKQVDLFSLLPGFEAMPFILSFVATHR